MKWRKCLVCGTEMFISGSGFATRATSGSLPYSLNIESDLLRFRYKICLEAALPKAMGRINYDIDN